MLPPVVHPPVLPVGLHDMLHDAALKQEQQLQTIRDVFQQNDIALVLPPLLEYEETLIDSHINSEDTFRTLEVNTGKTLTFRTDITPQVARLATSRLAEQSRPLKLGYYGTVLNQQTSQRQRTQVGIEIIGDTPDIVSIIQLALSLFEKVYDQSSNAVCVQLCYPALINTLDSDTKHQADNRTITQKQIENLSSQSQYQVLKTLEEHLTQHKINTIIDILEFDGFAYQTGPCFNIIDQDKTAIWAKGGVYTLPNNETAVGFSFYLKD